jgi:hypothetical protein
MFIYVPYLFNINSHLDLERPIRILRGFRRASARVENNDFKDLDHVRGYPHGRETV